MKCAKCGAEIRTGCVYCSNCGEEAQIVTEIHVLEDDLLRAMLEEREAKEKKESEAFEKKKADEIRKKKLREKRQKNKRTLILLIILLAAACTVIFGLVKYRQNSSVDYLMDKAQAAYAQKEYQTALDYLDRALELDENYGDALLLQGKIHALIKDDELALELFLKVISLEPACQEAYEYLLELYDKNGAYDKIAELKKDVADTGILALFDEYVVSPPVIEQESGRYSEFFEVTISAPAENVEIYYTLDGTVPTKEDTKYEDAIEISEQGRIILTAVCLNTNGIYSDPAVAEYKIELEAPEAPRVSPDGGQFTTPQTIEVSVPDGVSVYYTWDGSTPTGRSDKYTSPLEMPEGNNILSLVAIDEYGMESEVVRCNYIYYPE